MFEKVKNKLILNKLKVKEGTLNILSFKGPRELKLYKQFLTKNLKTLKKIDLTSTRAAIQLKLNKKASYPAFDWQKKLVSLNNIFFMMIGIIDARNDQYERDLAFQRKFNEIKEIQDIELKQKNLIDYRLKVSQDYQNFCKRDDMKVIKETMKCNPSYKNFNNLFEDMKENSYSLVIQGQLISAYMFGYNNSLYIQPQDIMPYYEQIISDYSLDKAKNNCDYQKINILTK